MTLIQISTALLKRGLRVARVPADGDPECVGSVECVECGWRADGLRLDVLAGEKDAGCCACAVRKAEGFEHISAPLARVLDRIPQK